MIQKRKLLLLTVSIFLLFILLISSFMRILITEEHERSTTVQLSPEEKILKLFDHLPDTYKVRRLKDDNITRVLLKNLKNKLKIRNIKQIWIDANAGVSKTQLYNSSLLGLIRLGMKRLKIVFADLDSRGTQLKLLLTLEGGQQVVFKPKWYEIDKIIEGPVYAGKDRYGSEIVAFYLSAILNKPFAPISIDREINIKKEILPVASSQLLTTVFQYKNHTCIYGKCYYCKKEDPICDNQVGSISGAVIFNVKGEIKSYKSPWQRTYKSNKKATWETSSDFCKSVKEKLSKSRIYDLIDAAIFDFLIQNGDRHHYETLNDKIIFLDNGKGLGNPNVHHIDILAPLYQCCMIRTDTWERLLNLSGGLLKETLLLIPDIKKIVTQEHISAMEKRLLIVYATVEYCKSK